jgi:hypothetical protein
VTTPQNKGFDPEYIGVRLRDAEGHTYEELDADVLTPNECSGLYAEAMNAAGTRYPIRQVFGSRKNSAMSEFGKHIPALIVLDGTQPVEVFPHEEDSSYVTIRSYVDAL